MLLEILFFSANDLFLVPICLLILYGILYFRAKRCEDPEVSRMYFYFFYFKIFFSFAYTLITEFYFEGGDTSLYFHGIKYLRQAIDDNIGMVETIIKSISLSETNPLAPYFIYGDYGNGISYNYMLSGGNFFVCRLGIIPAFLFFNSYLCISFCFSFFAMGGAIRLFKTFYYYYPYARKEIAIAALFLPSVAFWSAGLLKDTICFGCVGFILYGVLNIFVKRKNIIASVFWILISGYLLYYIKTYILLTLLLAIIIWLFFELSATIKQALLRRFVAAIAFVAGIALSYFLVKQISSADTLKQYQLENIISSAEYQRSNYEYQDKAVASGTSYYEINSSNYFVLVLNSIGTVFFRPFLWEVTSSAAILSAIEALGFLLLTVYLFFKRGLLKPFQLIFKDPLLTMAFIFTISFAIGVGISTANFGALSRYKIPCLPFYLITILIVYRKSGLAFPAWFNKILNLIK